MSELDAENRTDEPESTEPQAVIGQLEPGSTPAENTPPRQWSLQRATTNSPGPSRTRSRNRRPVPR